MRTMLLCSVVLGIGFCHSAFAADDCSDAPDQASMNECAGKLLKAADTELNAKYKEIETRLIDPDTRKMFVKSQRAWIAFRDAECEFQTSGVSGGSIYPTIYAQCMTALTNARLSDFSVYLNCEEGDLSCPVPPKGN